jgi:hypothetical protein
MSLRHRWTVPLECLACHTSGHVGVSERAGPPFQLVSEREYTFTSGFQQSLGIATGLPDRFECCACHAEATPPLPGAFRSHH